MYIPLLFVLQCSLGGEPPAAIHCARGLDFNAPAENIGRGNMLGILLLLVLDAI